MEPVSVSEIARAVQLLGGGALAYFILKLLVPYLERQRPAASSNGAARTLALLESLSARSILIDAEIQKMFEHGMKGVEDVLREDRAVRELILGNRQVMKEVVEELVQPHLLKLIVQVDDAPGKLARLDADVKELHSLMRQRHERDLEARAAMQVGLSNYARDVQELKKMVAKLTERES